MFVQKCASIHIENVSIVTSIFLYENENEIEDRPINV